MDEASYIVVFPTIFAKKRIPLLVSNIKEILKLRNQKFQLVKRDGDIVIVHANDPVFASSAINLLFGIQKVAITRKTNNTFDDIVSTITTLGGNLLLRDERFLVQVEGISKGFLTKDVEMAATSSIIEEKMNLGVHPGTIHNYDKLLYTYLTKTSAYVCIFVDSGNGGIPYTSKQDTVCAIYDELSAIACYETIKQGYNTKVIICYKRKSELMNLVKMVNRIIPRLVCSSIDIDFLNLNSTNYNLILEILLAQNLDRISLALSPLLQHNVDIDYAIKRTFAAKKIPLLPLLGAEQELHHIAKHLGINLERVVKGTKSKDSIASSENVSNSLKTKKTISVKIGPNNIHDILDSLDL